MIPVVATCDDDYDRSDECGFAGNCCWEDQTCNPGHVCNPTTKLCEVAPEAGSIADKGVADKAITDQAIVDKGIVDKGTADQSSLEGPPTPDLSPDLPASDSGPQPDSSTAD